MTIISTPSLGARFALFALLSFSSAFCLWKSHTLRRRRLSSLHLPNPNPNPNPNPKIIFASQTGTSQSLARRLAALLSSHGVSSDLIDPRHYEPEELPNETVILIVASTWEDGKPPPNSAFLSRWLAESSADFRVGSLMLSRCRFAVFGVGSRAYGSTFNAAARDLARWMKELGAAEMMPICEGDVDGGEIDKEFDSWSEGILRVMKGGRSEGVEELEEDVEESYEEEEEEEEEEEYVVDLEDIAGKAPSRRTKGEVVNGNGGGIKEMVTPIIRKNLERQVMVLWYYCI